VSTTDPAPPTGEHLDSRLEFETLISDLTSRFVNLPSGEVDLAIEDVLRRVCELLGIEFAALWQWPAGPPDVITPTHACPAGDPSLPRAGVQDDYPWTVAQVRAGRTLVLPSLDDLPAEAAVDGASARRASIRSNVTFPLAVGGDPPVGALALNMVSSPRDWPDEIVNRLRLVAQVFANALERKRSEEALRTSAARLAAGADLAGLAHYEVDFDRGHMFIDDRLRDLCGIPPERASSSATSRSGGSSTRARAAG
jgi:GAF domain-containing protein